jgi:hypothetical protein
VIGRSRSSPRHIALQTHLLTLILLKIKKFLFLHILLAMLQTFLIIIHTQCERESSTDEGEMWVDAAIERKVAEFSSRSSLFFAGIRCEGEHSFPSFIHYGINFWLALQLFFFLSRQCCNLGMFGGVWILQITGLSWFLCRAQSEKHSISSI